MYKKAERERHESKLLLPKGGRWFPKEEPGTMQEGRTEEFWLPQLAPEARMEQEDRTAQNELL